MQTMTMSEYLTLDAISASQVKDVHSKGLWWLKHAPQRASTPAQDAGSYIHAFLLNQQDELDLFAVEPEPMDRRTKTYKEWAADQEGKVIVKNEVGMMAVGIQASLEEHGLSHLLNGHPEVTFVSNEQHPRKARPDVYNENQGLIVDIKTCEDIDAFPYDFRRYRYALSEPHYLDVIGPYNTYIWLAVEKKHPHRCQWYVTSSETSESARTAYDMALADLIEAKETGIYPTRVDDAPVRL